MCYTFLALMHTYVDLLFSMVMGLELCSNYDTYIPLLLRKQSRRITAGPGANSDRKAGLFCSEQDVLSYCDPVVVAPALARSPPGAMARSLAAVCEVSMYACVDSWFHLIKNILQVFVRESLLHFPTLNRPKTVPETNQQVREAGGEKYYRLCEARLEAWTELKLVRIEEALSQAQPECGREKAGASANNKSRTTMSCPFVHCAQSPSVCLCC